MAESGEVESWADESCDEESGAVEPSVLAPESSASDADASSIVPSSPASSADCSEVAEEEHAAKSKGTRQAKGSLMAST